MEVAPTELLHLIATEPLILAVRRVQEFDWEIVDIGMRCYPTGSYSPRRHRAERRDAPACVLSDEYRSKMLVRSGRARSEVERREGSVILAPLRRQKKRASR